MKKIFSKDFTTLAEEFVNLKIFFVISNFNWMIRILFTFTSRSVTYFVKNFSIKIMKSKSNPEFEFYFNFNFKFLLMKAASNDSGKPIP